ncbi:MAG: hypothetical protein ACREPL_11600 [Rhodanobacteraceae bacterium]
MITASQKLLDPRTGNKPGAARATASATRRGAGVADTGLTAGPFVVLPTLRRVATGAICEGGVCRPPDALADEDAVVDQTGTGDRDAPASTSE